MIQLVDSSDFHGSPENEWKYKLHRIKQFLTPNTLKYTLYILLWFITGRISLEFHLHGIFVIVSGFALIFCNLGKRQEGTMSAYSIFNEGFYNVIGTFTASDVDHMFSHRNAARQSGNDQQEQQIKKPPLEKSPFDGLTDEQMMAKLSKLGNTACFCDSGRKYKKCHYYIQQREKQQELEEASKGKLKQQ